MTMVVVRIGAMTIMKVVFVSDNNFLITAWSLILLVIMSTSMPKLCALNQHNPDIRIVRVARAGTLAARQDFVGIRAQLVAAYEADELDVASLAVIAQRIHDFKHVLEAMEVQFDAPLPAGMPGRVVLNANVDELRGAIEDLELIFLATQAAFETGDREELILDMKLYWERLIDLLVDLRDQLIELG